MAVHLHPEGGAFASEQFTYLSNWLGAAEAERARAALEFSPLREIYRVKALTPVQENGRFIRTFAPFDKATSALYTLTRAQKWWLLSAGGVLLCGLALHTLMTIVLVIASITILYFSDLLLHLYLALRTVSATTDNHIDETTIAALADHPWPRYTILCPLYHEPEIVPQFVTAMKALDYPPELLQILVLTEQDDEALRTVLHAQGLPAMFQVLTVPDGELRTKPRACNFGLLYAEGEYVVIYDAEDIPDPLQLKRAVLTFALCEREHPALHTVCVQARLNFYNPQQNILTKWFTAEYSLWFDLTLPGLQRLGLPLPLGGTSNHFRTAALLTVGGWDAFNVTEDCELGLRLARYGMHTAMLDSTTYEEANSRLKNWLRQRSRWIKGYMLTYLIAMREPKHYFTAQRWKEFFALQLVVGGKTFVLFINPFMWALVGIYLLAHAHVSNLYHVLFPGPILYMGAICLIFGNFLYLYINFIGCLKHGHLNIMLWVFTMPLYWALNSVAAFLALYQLIVKPHFWEKTQHGLHLAPLVSGNGTSPRIIAFDRAIARRTLPALPTLTPLRSSQAVADPKADVWHRATLLVTYIVSLCALWYYFHTRQILLYGDAYAHLLIPRRVFDNVTPGLAQLGGVWLPLPHLLMLPFIWNDFLFRSGLAGSIPSMVCFVLAANYVYLTARYLTHNRPASFVGTLIFIVNPNVLYLQSTALTEPVLIATLAAAGYYFLRWAREDDPRLLIWVAFATFLASLARYDGWFLFIAILPAIIAIGRLRHDSKERIRAHLLLFGSFGGLGIGLWFVWNQLIFGDALYFQRGPYASQTQQTILLHAHLLYTYHDLWQSFRYYSIDAMQNLGPLLFCLAVAALVLWYRRPITPDHVALSVFLTPFAFYVLALFLGQAALYAPGAVPPNDLIHQIYNARYGVQVVAPAALFVATLAARQQVGRWQVAPRVMFATLIAVVLAQTALTLHGGIISLQDGQSGIDCAAPHPIVTYLAEHYQGGRILEDLYANKVDAVNLEATIDFDHMVYEGSRSLWQQALAHPASAVDWVVINPASPTVDLVNQNINKDEFYQQFSLALEEPNGLSLYQRNGIVLATRAVPIYLLHEHANCLDPTQLKIGTRPLDPAQRTLNRQRSA